MSRGIKSECFKHVYTFHEVAILSDYIVLVAAASDLQFRNRITSTYSRSEFAPSSSKHFINISYCNLIPSIPLHGR